MTAVAEPTPVTTPYEQQLDSDPRWALAEGSRHFDEKSKVFTALHRICERLRGLGIPFVVVGGMALFRHGFRRFTEDVDLLVTKADLKTIHDKLSGLGYLPPHTHSKHLRDTELGVRIEFLTAGEFPGDGKPKPVAFPEPSAESIVEIDGTPVLALPKLIDLKLASGITNAGRLKDLADVQELIRVLNLPPAFADQLDPWVRAKFAELHAGARKRYLALWRNNRPSAAAETLEAMLRDGVMLEPESGVPGHALLVTTDPEVARRYDMVEESEFWSEAAGDQ